VGDAAKGTNVLSDTAKCFKSDGKPTYINWSGFGFMQENQSDEGVGCPGCNLGAGLLQTSRHALKKSCVVIKQGPRAKIRNSLP